MENAGRQAIIGWGDDLLRHMNATAALTADPPYFPIRIIKVSLDRGDLIQLQEARTRERKSFA